MDSVVPGAVTVCYINVNMTRQGTSINFNPLPILKKSSQRIQIKSQRIEQLATTDLPENHVLNHKFG
jgi:hypothetical protein